MPPRIPSLELGHITTLGLLYEGSDYELWKTKMERILRFEAYDGALTGGSACRYWAPDSVSNARVMIQAHVSPSVWSRFNQDLPVVWDRQLNGLLPDALDYDKQLRALTHPFRFLDLPAEIRNNIYTIIIQGQGSFRVPVGKRLVAPFVATVWPPVLHASSQLRTESLSLFYATTEFQFHLQPYLKEKNGMAKVEQAFTSWLRDVVRETTKHLGQVKILKVGYRRDPFYEELAHSDKQDLAILFSHNNRAGTGERGNKKNHVAVTSQACKLAGVKNQSIVIALANSPILCSTRSIIRYIIQHIEELRSACIWQI